MSGLSGGHRGRTGISGRNGESQAGSVSEAIGRGAVLTIGISNYHIDRTGSMCGGGGGYRRAADNRHMGGRSSTELNGRARQEAGTGDGNACPAVGSARVRRDRGHRRRRVGVGVAAGQRAALAIRVGDHDAACAGCVRRRGRGN